MTDDLIGKQIGGYEILNLIGEGGMATVYRARQISMNRDVALKVLPQQFLNDDTYLHRFEREVAIVAQLEHRNIVPVHDYGEYNGQPYIVMRYMPAGSVDDLLAKGPVPLPVSRRIIEQVAPALDYAHSKGVLHRDLKPSNVLLDDDGGAYITDFGIARILGEQGPGITTQGVVGTPSYMSPEQAQAHSLDGRSDVYALGVVLFEMLTGHRPFKADTPYGIAVMQVTQEPPQPRSFSSDIPVEVEQVVLKVLNKKPDRRYPTATALSVALQQAIDHPAAMHDTQPRFKLPAKPTVPAPDPAQSASQRPYTPPTPQSSRPVSPQMVRLEQRVRRRRASNPWLSVIIGGLIGCGLLTIIVLGVLFVMGSFLSGGNPSSAAQETDEVLPTLDATSEAARRTLVFDATQTASAQQLVPTPQRSAPPAAGVRGTVIFFDERQETGYEIVKLDLASGNETQLTLDQSVNSYPLSSADGSRIVFQSDRDGDFDIYVTNPVGGDLVKITRNDVYDRLPAWSPDGEWVYFSHDARGDHTFDLYRVRPDGSDLEPVFSNGQRNSHVRISPDGRYAVFTTGDPEDAATWEIGRLDLETESFALLTENEVRDASPVFGPDGETILFTTEGEGNGALARMNIDGTGLEVLFDGPGFEWSANYSPNGRFIVFNSDETGQDELYLMTAEGENVQRITDQGGAYASWIP